MCFSAAGSFALAGILTGVGGACIAEATSVRQSMFAAVPLIFAAQQASEGIVWLTIDAPAHAGLEHAAVLAFLSFALVLWPIWLPVSLAVVEGERSRRHVLFAMGALGGCVAVVAAGLLARSMPVATVAGHSLRYDRASTGSAALDLIGLVAYAIPTVGPFFVSTTRLTRAMGAMLIASLVAAILVQRDALTSVWCFFAAILSTMVFVSVRQAHRSRVPSGDGPRYATARRSR